MTTSMAKKMISHTLAWMICFLIPFWFRLVRVRVLSKIKIMHIGKHEGLASLPFNYDTISEAGSIM
jgi:hypothetical protein